MDGVCIIALMDSRKIFIAGVAVVAMITGVWLSSKVLQEPVAPRVASVLPASDLADFSLVDHDGNTFRRDDFKGSWSLLFFGFTHCPDICPITLQILVNARRAMETAGEDELPTIVLVSVDPERDTPDIMRQYVSNFGTDTVGITGSLDELRKLTKGLGIYFEKAEADGDNYTVNHSAAVMVLNPDGQLQAIFSAPHIAENIAHDLPILMSRL